MRKYTNTERLVDGLVDFDVDTNLISKTQSTGMANFFKYSDFIGKAPGRTAYGSASGAVMKYYPFKIGDTNKFMKFTTTGIYYRSSTGWTDVTGSALTGTIDNFIDCCAVYDDTLGTFYVVFTNGKDNMRKFDGTNNTSDLSAWTSYKSRFVRYLNGYLIAFHITEGGVRYGFRCRTSHTNNPNDTTSGNSKTFNLTKDKNISDIVAVEHFGNYLAVYKSDCIYFLWLAASTSQILDFDVKFHETGLRAPRGLCVDDKGGHFFLGTNDVMYAASPSSNLQAVGAGFIRKRLFNDTVPEYLKRAIMVFDQRYNKVRIYVPENYYCDTVYVLDINTQKWSWWQESRLNITAAGSYLRDEIVSIDDLSGTIDSLTGTIDDLSGALQDNFPVVLEGDKDGNSKYQDASVVNDGNITVSAYYDTGDDVFSNDQNEIYTYERVDGIQIEAKGDKVTLYYSIDEGTTWTQITTGVNPDGTFWTNFITLSDEWEWYECHFDVVTKKIRYRYENNDNDSTCYVRKNVRMGEDREMD